MRKNKYLSLTLSSAIPIITLLYLSPVKANDQTSQIAPSATMGQLEELHTKNILLQAKVQGAQLSRQLEENQTGANSRTQSTVIPPQLGETTNPLSISRTRPVVLEINGRDRKLQAQLLLSNGQMITVTPGSQIPSSGVTVKSISISGVTLSDGSILTF
ncbi:type IV pilus biogenesis protein PilP [Pectobacterium atrosepticum]|uniref:type IV pilus biogenesis protein PilP n=1 Tax=Pectobacterium atrosepticum TaxID=29471 RepID=UPI0030180885